MYLRLASLQYSLEVLEQEVERERLVQQVTSPLIISHHFESGTFLTS